MSYCRFVLAKESLLPEVSSLGLTHYALPPSQHCQVTIYSLSLILDPLDVMFSSEFYILSFGAWRWAFH